MNINFFLFKLLNDQKKNFCCSDQIYNISNKFFYFFRCIQLCVFFEMRKTPTFFYIEFFTYKHKLSINPLTILLQLSFYDYFCFFKNRFEISIISQIKNDQNFSHIEIFDIINNQIGKNCYFFSILLNKETELTNQRITNRYDFFFEIHLS